MKDKTAFLLALLASIVFGVALGSCTAARGEITTPASTEPYRILQATANVKVPEGATIKGGWGAPTLSFIETGDGIAWTGKPGQHVITYKGVWALTEDFVLNDVDGNPKTLPVLMDFGQFDEAVTVTVIGSTPDPPVPGPGPGPQPSGSKHLVFFLEEDNLDKMPYAQSYLVTSRVARENLERRGHKLIQILDDDVITMNNPPDKWLPWIDAVKGDPLPRVAIASADGGEVVDYPMPPDWNRLLELLGEK